jgi:hypothetical protein
MAALLVEHRGQDDVSLEQHLASLEESVAREALGKTRVYLDLRYWIFLRDADLGKPKRPVHVKLFDAMLRGVSEGKFVCPITDAVFFELDRQGNTERRMQTIRMIDRLCQGIVIKNSMERPVWEIRDFFDAVLLRKELPAVPCRRAWVRPYSFLGTPQIGGWGPAEDLAINKAFLSYMWTRSIEDLLTDTPVSESKDDAEFRKTAARITKSSAKYEPQMRSFKQVFVDELGGLIQSHRDEICHAFRPHAAAMLRSIGAADCDALCLEQSGLNLAYSLAAAPKPHGGLPYLRIMSGLHSYIRWQRRRPFRFQDFFDLRHAAAAIPYCDVFLTEKFMKTACTSSLLDFGSIYETQIISDEDEALELVSRLGGIPT